MAAASGQDLAYLIQAARDRSQGAARALQTQWGKPPHEGHSRVLSDDPDTIVPRRSQACACCGASLNAALPAEIISVAEQIELPAVAPIVIQYQRFAVCCPSCGTRVIAPSPEAARGTPFDPRLHAVATYLKTLQALSYERLQAALSDLFGLTLNQGGLMNLLRRAQGCFRSDCDAAIATLRRAEVIACDETGVRIEGANAYHWLFHSAAAVVHTASPTRGAVVVREMMDEHRPAVWTRTATPPNKATRMVVFPFARDAFFPVCSPGLLEGPHALRTPDDLRHHPLIHDTSMASTAAFRTWRDWHLAAGLDTSESERGLRINDSAAAYRMAMAGHGVALGRTTLVEQDLKDRRLVRPFGPVLDCGLAYHVVCRPQDVQDQTINAFRDWLIGEVMSEAKV